MNDVRGEEGGWGTSMLEKGDGDLTTERGA